MKFAFGIVVLALALPSAILACKTLEELDNCAYEMSFMANENIKTPTNDAEVLDMCARGKKGIKCLKDEAIECMKGPMKSMTVKVFKDLEEHFNSRCDSAPHRAEFLKHVQCFTDPAKAAAIRLCGDKHMGMMEKVSNLPKELLLGGSCCSTIAMRDCFIGQIRSQCSGESGDYFNDMIEEAHSENHQLMCSEYLNMGQCDAKYDAATWKDLKAIYESNDVAALKKHQYKTVVPIFVKMLQANSARK